MVSEILYRLQFVAAFLTAAAVVQAGNRAQAGEVPAAGAVVEFNRDVRPLLARNCFACHGPDTAQRQGKLRLDTREGATAPRPAGAPAIVPGEPAKSELVRRITAPDPAERMPPADSGKTLQPEEARLLARWVEEGAPYAVHWAYAPPVLPPLPEVRDRSWPRSPADRFVLARLEREGMAPSPQADRYALARRAALDLTGLPLSVEEADAFAADDAPDAYERLIDRLLASPAYGEHWARLWLDLARYADSAGYADDPPRTIWPYRDYAIASFNAGKPFDRFTVEQLAGDLLPEPAEAELIATGFHRNTQTNNEGGTNDEEFRNVAVADRVNTTMSVWMGTTIACAQCHNHKYDPITQEEYFRFFAFFNSTEDADRTDEQPVLQLWSEEDKRRQAELHAGIARLEEVLHTSTPELAASQARWEEGLAAELAWQVLAPAELQSQSGAPWRRLDDGSLLVESAAKTDVYTLAAPLPEGRLSAIRLEALPDAALPQGGPGHGDGNFVVTRVSAWLVPPGASRVAGRYVRIELPGKDKILSLAEVEVFAGGENLAPRGEASQSSTDFDGPSRLAIDGNTDGRYSDAKSTTHTAISENPWWELDLKEPRDIDQLVLWNRVDGGLYSRLSGFRLAVLDGERKPVWERTVTEAPNPSAAFSPSGVRELPLAAAYASYTQPGFAPESVLGKKGVKGEGWAVGGKLGEAHALTLLPAAPEDVPPGHKLSLRIEQLSRHERHTLGRLRLAASADSRAAELAQVGEQVLAIARTPALKRTEAERAELASYYLGSVAPELALERTRLAAMQQELAGIKPASTTPIFRELPAGKRRATRIQRRGNFLDIAGEVTEGVPAAFHALPEVPAGARLALARWLMDAGNPLAARVLANRYWEKLFGAGIVLTSEDFGTQGDLPSHPELLDWLAVEVKEGGWDLKQLLKLLVTSAAYRQSSRVTPEHLERDAENRLLSRGPRLRLPAEEVRDQALFAAGLLSFKMHGPPVRPPQPSLGLSAAFGPGIDWQTSEGEDRYRRAIYTTWRRSSPYPSMATFDAPNREVCTVRRARTNTPLQALVTLNDPVYVEAAQALARRMVEGGGGPAGDAAAIARRGFRLVLARPPTEEEAQRLADLHAAARDRLRAVPEDAARLATVPVGPAREGADTVDLAAWTVVANVLLNLDETLMKR